jgi:glyoxylase-like metal-dependent hydrolase (beta-lactamase superfamily II)
MMFGFSLLLMLALLKGRGEAQPNSFSEVVKGVWFREGDLDQGHCNNTVIEMKDGLVVIDANFPSGARRVMEDIKKVSSKPVKYVFDTHHHGDHFYGNVVWTRAGAITLAYQGVADELKRYEPGRWQATDRPDVKELKLSAPEPPKQTFSKTPFVLEDETRRIEFHFFGWAHTRGDGFAYLPKEKILCTGDAAVNGPYNFIGDGNVGNWPRVLDAALKKEALFVLPGHGPRGGVEILKGQKLFFEQLLGAVSAEIKNGKTQGQIVVFKEKNPKSTTIQLPETVRKWVGPDLASQVVTTYQELTQKKPAGDLPH